LKMVNYFRISYFSKPFLAFPVIIFLSGIMLSFSAPDLYSQISPDREIAKALEKIVQCEEIEVKTKGGENGSGKLKSMFIKLKSVSGDVLPADYITAQYTNPAIDLKALRNSGIFNVTSYSDFKIGVLVSEQSIKKEFEKTAKKLNIRYNKFLIKFTPPYIELEFDIPVSGISPEDRKPFERFIKNNKFEGYAAISLEVHENKLSASPTKVILNHFLLPTPVIAELKKRINPIRHIPRIQPFSYSLEKVGIQKRFIMLKN
jgi:hypothetical protein